MLWAGGRLDCGVHVSHAGIVQSVHTLKKKCGRSDACFFFANHLVRHHQYTSYFVASSRQQITVVMKSKRLCREASREAIKYARGNRDPRRYRNITEIFIMILWEKVRASTCGRKYRFTDKTSTGFTVGYCTYKYNLGKIVIKHRF